jgi:P27 family predicted phage terminase small subunit
MEAILRKEGRVIRRIAKNGEEISKRHPAFDIATELRKRLKDLEASFGLTPSARARIDIKKAPATLTPKQKKNMGPLRVVPKQG